MGGWAANFWDNRKCPWLPSLSIKVSSTQILAQINSQECIGHIKQHFMTTSPVIYVTNVIQNSVKCCMKNWMHFDLTTCYLVDYNPELLLRSSKLGKGYTIWKEGNVLLNDARNTFYWWLCCIWPMVKDRSEKKPTAVTFWLAARGLL